MQLRGLPGTGGAKRLIGQWNLEAGFLLLAKECMMKGHAFPEPPIDPTYYGPLIVAPKRAPQLSEASNSRKPCN